MKKYVYGNIECIVFNNGSFTVQPVGTDMPEALQQARANFEISVWGGRQLLLTEQDFTIDKITDSESSLELKYVNNNLSLLVTVSLEFIKDTDVVVQKNTVCNIGNENIRLTKFSSAFIDFIGYCADRNWYDSNMTVHICHNKWQGEAQWQKYTPKQLGLYPATIHSWERESYKIQSVGSWSTRCYYPMMIIEDKDLGYSWFMETEGSHSWFMKLCSYGGYDCPSLSVEASGCDESNGGWYYDLKPQECYSTERAFYGVCKGGFEEAVCNLNKFKRIDSFVKTEDNIPHIAFNSYMNCLWVNQKPELLERLIDASADAGCEVFCIDDGWETNENGNGLGDWLLKEDFPLKELADKICSRGMVPGIWFELDACNDTAYGYNMCEASILKRYGQPIGGNRCFYNFKKSDVRKYLMERIEFVYDMGYRFIKNDYNQSVGIGCTNNYDGDSCAEGAIQNADAFYDFISEVYDRFPDLIIENCGSGALRDDNKMLRMTSLQSTSDQEIYYNNPSIVMGSMAVMPPEKAGIWSYPYPAEFGKLEFDEEYVLNRKNGYETSFNMVTAMLGGMYLSGRIDLCDDINKNLITQAIEMYGKIRKYIPVSRPVYPSGMHLINNCECTSFGLLSEDTLILAVWNVNSSDREFTVDLSKYISKGAEAVESYPNIEGVNYVLNENILNVKFPAQNTAILIEIRR